MSFCVLPESDVWLFLGRGASLSFKQWREARTKYKLLICFLMYGWNGSGWVTTSTEQNISVCSVLLMVFPCWLIRVVKECDTFIIKSFDRNEA